MGIEFAAHTADQRAQVMSFIGFLSSRPGTLPELLITPRALAEDSQAEAPNSEVEELDDPLLELLRGHESMSQDDFLQALRQQRNSTEEVAPA
jgi:hypothetical protein